MRSGGSLLSGTPATLVEGVRNWSEIPPKPTAEEIMAVVLNPRFGGFSARIQEAILLAVVAFLIAVVMWRARMTLKRQLEAETISVRGLSEPVAVYSIAPGIAAAA